MTPCLESWKERSVPSVRWVVAAAVAEALVGLLLRCHLPTLLSGLWTVDKARPHLLDDSA